LIKSTFAFIATECCTSCYSKLYWCFESLHVCEENC